mmetsp:Transcript_12959/g.51538  ORF Transcript_12959/g.51538 Transcript_12959/m.51538 type:complete len:150 (-) Transcript_12959:115-564(-)
MRGLASVIARSKLLRKYFSYGLEVQKPANAVGNSARRLKATAQKETRERQLSAKEELELRAEAEYYAAWATNCMLPWERAQMNENKTPLRLWERLYWAVFPVLGISGFIYEMRGSNNKLRHFFRNDQDIDPEIRALYKHSEFDRLWRFF